MPCLLGESACVGKTRSVPGEATDKIKHASSFPGVRRIHLNIYSEQIHFNEFSVKVESTH